jgi:hypothetical protein
MSQVGDPGREVPPGNSTLLPDLGSCKRHIGYVELRNFSKKA